MIKILENDENQMYRGGQDLAGTEDGFDVRAGFDIGEGALAGLYKPIVIDSGDSGTS